jgi:hypothetical protein
MESRFESQWFGGQEIIFYFFEAVSRSGFAHMGGIAAAILASGFTRRPRTPHSRGQQLKPDHILVLELITGRHTEASETLLEYFLCSQHHC